jgi:hypothetical protein
MTPRHRAALGPGLGFGLVLFLLLEALPVETQYEYDFYDDFISGGDSGYDDYPYPDYRTDQAVPLNGFAAFRMVSCASDRVTHPCLVKIPTSRVILPLRRC